MLGKKFPQTVFFLNSVSRVSICTCFNVNAAFFYRNQTSLVNLQLLTNNKKVEQVVYGREYTLRADITHADGKILISSKAKKTGIIEQVAAVCEKKGLCFRHI